MSIGHRVISVHVAINGIVVIWLLEDIHAVSLISHVLIESIVIIRVFLILLGLLVACLALVLRVLSCIGRTSATSDADEVTFIIWALLMGAHAECFSHASKMFSSNFTVCIIFLVRRILGFLLMRASKQLAVLELNSLTGNVLRIRSSIILRLAHEMVNCLELLWLGTVVLLVQVWVFRDLELLLPQLLLVSLVCLSVELRHLIVESSLVVGLASINCIHIVHKVIAWLIVTMKKTIVVLVQSWPLLRFLNWFNAEMLSIAFPCLIQLPIVENAFI